MAIVEGSESGSMACFTQTAIDWEKARFSEHWS